MFDYFGEIGLKWRVILVGETKFNNFVKLRNPKKLQLILISFMFSVSS